MTCEVTTHQGAKGGVASHLKTCSNPRGADQRKGVSSLSKEDLGTEGLNQKSPRAGD